MPAHGPKGKAGALALSAAVLLAAAPASAANAQSGYGGCLAACERNVEDRATRARACNRCLFHGDARGGWVEDLARLQPFPEDALRRTLHDPDWMVVREAARALAKRHRQREEAALAAHLAQASEAALEHVCPAVARIGADRKLTLRAWQKTLSDHGGKHGRRAFSLLARCERRTLEGLELELYGVGGGAQEALRHLVALTGRSEAAVVLEAMRSRPAEADPFAAAALLRLSEAGGGPVGLLLLRAATEENQDRVNRLVALYMADISRMAGKAKPLEALARRAAVTELGRYAPLSEPELEPYLWDDDLPVRLAAARAIARGEGRDVEAAVRARVLGPSPAPPRLQVRWVELLGRSGAKTCHKGVLQEITREAGAPVEVRTAAVVAWAACVGPRAGPVVHRALESPDAAVRAGGARALADLGRTKENRARAGAALEDDSELVRAAACDAVGALGMKDKTAEVAANLDAPSAALRAAAVRALGQLEATSQTGRVAQKLREDPDREVRLSAVAALRQLGGAQAAAALSEAAAKDSESRVRHLAEQALRGMGFAR